MVRMTVGAVGGRCAGVLSYRQTDRGICGTVDEMSTRICKLIVF